MESISPLANQVGTSHQNGFSASTQPPRRLGLGGELQRRGILAAGAGDGQRLFQIEKQQGPAAAFVFARHHLVIAVLVETHQRVLRRLLAGPFVLVVPPGDNRRHVQVFSLHQQLDVFQRPVNVRFARPPALLGEIDDPLQVDHFRVVGKLLNDEIAGAIDVFGAALDFKRVLPARKSQGDLAGANEMIVPERRARDLAGPAGGVLQMNAAGDRLPGLGIDDRQFQLFVSQRRLAGGQPADERQDRAGYSNDRAHDESSG